MCQQCEEQAAVFNCVDCEGKLFCDACFGLLHKAAKKKGHTKNAL